jgi:hypothetical protein
MAGVKCTHERKSKLSYECTAIDLDMKIIICEYEGGQILSVITLEPGFVVSAVNIIMKDGACMKEHVNFIFHLVYVCQYSIYY